MSPNPALMQVPPCNDFIETLAIFKTEQSIDQVNHDLVSLITLIGQNIKSFHTTQEDRERYYSYMLLLQKIYRLINDLNDIVSG